MVSVLEFGYVRTHKTRGWLHCKLDIAMPNPQRPFRPAVCHLEDSCPLIGGFHLFEREYLNFVGIDRLSVR